MDIRVAAYGIISDGSQILLAHWNEHGHSGWTLPGGGIDPGEDPADAVIREIREETGYEAEVIRLIGIDSLVTPAHRRLDPTRNVPLHNLRIVYEARVVSGELRYEENGSTDWAAWQPLDGVGTLGTVSLVPAALALWHAQGGPQAT
ncbi:NUDIX domain-containing protein [Mycetocola tolaasinivorans]|uniref:NUDIX domain-containing protein n=1 Tax=Mycetocola tolaasinivorans TaxID=76635 RepID=A0A3L7A5L4_9MICO|nr:NUDIX hydrolase [Mycetocola tolaasinivorans]RLP75218.1 NUDIX domain-containing protein [Mycetocola tolaasinivorans]